MKVALAQLTSTGDVAANLALVRDFTIRAADRGAELVVFPEATMCAFGHRLASIAEPLTGRWADGVREIAHACDLTVAVGMFTPAGQGRVHNTILVTGAVEAHYDKIHLFDALGNRESDAVAPGSRVVVVGIGPLTVGLATCYDVRFPDLFIDLARRGAQAILLPASWADGAGKLAQWQLLTRARALDSTSWLLACDQAQPPIATRHANGVGHSAVIGPDGVPVAELGPDVGLLVHEVDVSGLGQVREGLPVLRG